MKCNVVLAEKGKLKAVSGIVTCSTCGFAQCTPMYYITTIAMRDELKARIPTCVSVKRAAAAVCVHACSLTRACARNVYSRHVHLRSQSSISSARRAC